ncbi:hypothetical protein [Croceivirga sp. JEA036]|nr:hypothetical protein [Croceivirga sp. JEA036]
MNYDIEVHENHNFYMVLQIITIF